MSAPKKLLVTTDSVIFRWKDPVFQVLLIQRDNEPYCGFWALPGGFVEEDEGLYEAAARELREETTLEGIALTQFHAFGEVNRDPRGRVIAIAYYGVASPATPEPQARDDARAVGWFDLGSLPPLAFEHAEIIHAAWTALGGELSSMWRSALRTPPPPPPRPDYYREGAKPPVLEEKPCGHTDCQCKYQ